MEFNLLVLILQFISLFLLHVAFMTVVKNARPLKKGIRNGTR